MHRKILTLIMPFFILLGIFSYAVAGPKRAITKLDKLCEKDFEGLEIPKATIKAEGKSKSFPYVTFDEVWNSVIIVLMQKGIIIHLSKDSGVIITLTTPPSAILVESGEVVAVYLKWVENLYNYEELVSTKGPTLFRMRMDTITEKLDNPQTAFIFTPEDKEKMSKNLFNKLTTQVYSGKKWKYLYKY